ncbi:MAG: hypothetical protein JW739_04295 [Opitutales bacterium]|nr:hypothetical protein [Opitutales bacterium]
MILVAGSISMELEHLCNVFPEDGGSECARIHRRLGGKGALQAIAAMRCGSDVCFAGATGEDAMGKEIRLWMKNQLPQSHLAIYEGSPSGCCSVWQDSRGERRRLVAHGANQLLNLSDIPALLRESCAVLLLQLEGNRQTIVELLKKALNTECCRILNVTPMTPEYSTEGVHLANVVLCNQKAFSGLVQQLHPGGYGDFTENQIHALSDGKLHAMCRSCFEQSVVLTLGARGCFVSTREAHKLLPAVAHPDIVDCYGAGDVFAGALAAGLEKCAGDLFAAAAYANAVATLSCTRRGSVEAIPHKSEILTFLAREAG